jgi:hypothetical protein
VDLDTEAGYARYTLARPAQIDFAAIEDAAEGAGYTLKEMALELVGVTAQSDCKECGRPVPVLKIPETGQTLELEGDVPLGERLRIEASVQGWAEGHARLLVLHFEAAP